MSTAAVLSVAGVVITALLTGIASYAVARVQRGSTTEANGIQALVSGVATWQAIATRAESKADQAQADATSAHEQAQEATRRIEELERDLETERLHSREQDNRIRALVSVLRSWVDFGRELHQHWDEVRAHHYPPPLPEHEDVAEI